MSRALSAGRYGLDQVQVGDWWRTGTAQIGTDEIDRFADLTGDRFEIHMDMAAAARHGFPNRVAHGLLILSVIDGLKNQSPVVLNAVASLGWEWRFSAPVLAGAEVQARIEVIALRPTRDPDRGIVTLDFDVTDQTGARVQAGTNQLMIYRRAEAPQTS